MLLDIKIKLRKAKRKEDPPEKNKVIMQRLLRNSGFCNIYNGYDIYGKRFNVYHHKQDGKFRVSFHFATEKSACFGKEKVNQITKVRFHIPKEGAYDRIVCRMVELSEFIDALMEYDKEAAEELLYHLDLFV